LNFGECLAKWRKRILRYPAVIRRVARRGKRITTAVTRAVIVVENIGSEEAAAGSEIASRRRGMSNERKHESEKHSASAATSPVPPPPAPAVNPLADPCVFFPHQTPEEGT